MISYMSSLKPSQQDKLDHLIKAAEEGDISKLKYLIQDRNCNVNTRGPWGSPYYNRSLMLISFRNGKLEAAEYLIKLHADINAVDELGWTALHNAAFGGHVNVVKVLFTRYVNMITRTDNLGQNVFHLAAMEGLVDVVNTIILLNKSSAITKQADRGGQTALHKAAKRGHIDVVAILINAYPDMLMKTTHHGFTALHNAASRGHVDVVNLLLRYPDMITKTDKMGQTAVHKAARWGHVSVVDMLLRHHPDSISAIDNDGWTALHSAAGNGQLNVVDFLMDVNPDIVRQVDNNGNTPLDLAVIMNKSAVVWTMVHKHKHMVDISKCDQSLKEKIQRLLAAEEARQARVTFSYALKYGKAFSHELQILMIGAENSGKSCLVTSFIGETFIEEQKATDGADTDVCKIYCRNWSRMSLKDMTVQLHHQFISKFKESATLDSEYIPNPSNPPNPPNSSYPSETAENLPQPHPKDVQEAISYTPTNDSDSLNAVIWDFAGQVIFHNTHSIFISENGVPVITFNASMTLTDEVMVRKGANPPAECCTIISNIHYWLQVVDSMCSVKGSDEDHSPLLPTALLAGTHIDKLHPDIKEARKIAKRIILPVLEKELLGKPYARHLAGMKHGIKAALEQCCFFVSNKCRDEEIDRLKDFAIAVANSLRKEQPIVFLKIEQSLLLLKDKIISKSMMANIVTKSWLSVSENSLEFQGILNYFHTKRTILHFNQIESLEDLVILSPGWLAKLFSYVITAHSYITGTEQDYAWQQLTKYGILHENLLVHMLEKFHSDYPTPVHVTKQQIVDILLCFHLIALINRKAWFAESGYPTLPKCGDTFIVPSLVPRDHTKTIPCTENERIVYFKFDTGFIPTSVLNQLIADCICHNVKKGDQLLWMRHGKIGLQLGAHQKYYISRCEEKQSIQLTITIMEKDPKCIRERGRLIDDVTRMLKNIMDVFMPAAEKPVLLIPCSKCNALHITLKQVYEGSTVYCPMSNSDTPLHSYYSDLLPNAQTDADIDVDIKMQVFTKYYAKLVNILPIGSLTHYFVKDKVISSDEEKTILQAATQSEGARILLRKISGSLESHLTTSFNKLLSIMEQHGDISCVDLINEMRQDLQQDTTVQCLESLQDSASSVDEEKHQ